MSLSLIRAEYKTILETVAGIGIVHDYARLATDWKTFLDFFKTRIDGRDVIRGFEITREASPATQLYISGVSPSRVADRTHDILIRGYAGLQDASGSAKTFDDLCELILDTFLPLDSLNGKAVGVQPMVLTMLVEREFAGVLCHYCELRQRVVDRITY